MALTIVIAFGSAVVTAGALLVTYLSTPFNIDVVGQAGVTSTCQRQDLSSIASGKGDVAVIRMANCPGDLSQGKDFYVVFVHKSGVRNSQDNIAFQYMPGNLTSALTSPFSPPPKVLWTGASSLSITTKGIIEEIVKQRDQVGGIDINYVLRPNSVWARDSGYGDH